MDVTQKADREQMCRIAKVVLRDGEITLIQTLVDALEYIDVLEEAMLELAGFLANFQNSGLEPHEMWTPGQLIEEVMAKANEGKG